MQDLGKILELIEARLTLLERRITNSHALISEVVVEPSRAGPIKYIWLPFNDPGILISRMYPPEIDADGREFCWVGGEGPLQIVLPITPNKSAACRMYLAPHPHVDFGGLRLLVNDIEVKVVAEASKPDAALFSFNIPLSDAPSTSVLLLGVSSIRPSAFGENADNRLLAARFFGVEVADM